MGLAIAVALIAWLGGYAVLCAARPFAPCRKCGGLGKIRRLGKKRMCPRCHNKKLRLRVGRRAHNYWRRTRNAGSRPTPQKVGQ